MMHFWWNFFSSAKFWCNSDWLGCCTTKNQSWSEGCKWRSCCCCRYFAFWSATQEHKHFERSMATQTSLLPRNRSSMVLETFFCLYFSGVGIWYALLIFFIAIRMEIVFKIHVGNILLCCYIEDINDVHDWIMVHHKRAWSLITEK